MTYYRSTLIMAATMAITALPSMAQPPRGPAGMRGGMMAVNGDTAATAMMRVVHDLVMNHDKLRRTVTQLRNGVRTVTESDDPAMIRALQQHVATTGELVRMGRDPNMRMESPALHGVLRSGANINRIVRETAKGVVVTETSTDAPTVALLRQHAAEVTDLVDRGMTAMHESMMKNGGMGGGMMGGGMMGGGMMGGMAGGATGGMRAGMQPGVSDSAFAGVQARGQQTMGVDQNTSTHHFYPLPDGGRIQLQRNTDDPAGTAQIRTHLQEIAKAFGAGDFRTPAFVHMQTVPGAPMMAAKRAGISYTFTALPRGGELLITTKVPEAIAAIHQFMEFQRMDHRAH